jgi:hypothetical protein
VEAKSEPYTITYRITMFHEGSFVLSASEAEPHPSMPIRPEGKIQQIGLRQPTSLEHSRFAAILARLASALDAPLILAMVSLAVVSMPLLEMTAGGAF